MRDWISCLWRTLERIHTFCQDFEISDETLADLQVQAYQQAAHCYEELLLHSPQSIALYVRYAEVLYTMGGSHLRTARQYYAAALKLSDGEDLRALYGICCTSAAIAVQKVVAVFMIAQIVLQKQPAEPVLPGLGVGLVLCEGGGEGRGVHV